MKHKLSKRIVSMLLAFVLVVGLIPATALTVSAQNVTGQKQASGMRAGEAIVLTGNTTLNMDTDLTVPSITGDYDLTVQGSGKLTVNGSENGIDVKSLNCTSNLFIQTGWHAIEATKTVKINNAETFIVGGIYADGDIQIQSNNATIAGNGNAISSTGGNITLGGSTFDIGANGVAVYAKTGSINMEGNFTVNSNDNRAINALQGEVVVGGSLKSTSGAKFDPDDPNRYSIGAAGGFNFYGTTLEVTGVGGIRTGSGDISITADNVSVLTQKLTCIEGHTVFIDCDVLRLENAPNVNDLTVGQYGISCFESATVNCPDATIISCDHGIYANGFDVTLNGNFTILGKGDFGSGIWASNLYLNGGQFTVASNTQQAIYVGRVEVRGNLSVSTEGEDYCLFAQEFIFNGTTLAANGNAGIRGKYTDITADSVVITTDVGTPLCGYEVYVTADYLWAENKAAKDSSAWTQYGINAVSKLALTVKNGTVIGYDQALYVYDPNFEFDNRYIYVNGALTLVSKTKEGMYVPQGVAQCYGGPIVSVGETYGIYAKDVYFEGDSLRVDGNTGIYAANSVELSGEDIKITAFGERKSGIWCENGYVDMEGKVVINTAGWYGVHAGGDLTLGEGYFEISGPKGNAQAVKTYGTLTMDGTLEIVEPKYGHKNGNEIYGAGDSPAMEVLIYSAISDVSLLIDAPRAGKLPTRSASGIYFLDPRCTVEEIVWYEDGEELVSQDAKFRAGHSYKVKITISADGVYHFLEGVQGKVNDKAVSTGTSDRKIMYLTADMGKCPESVDTVELTIKAPVEGNTPSTAVTDPASEYGVYSRDVRWAVSTDGVNFTSMASGEKFVGGKYYRVFMDVNLAGNNYKFPTTTADGTLQPDVVSYVNGNPAVTEKAYDQDPQTVITVYFDFGKCNDHIIEEIDIVDIVAPVAGQHPTYTANMFGTGYHVDTTKNAYYDVYWKNPPEKWYYIKNGIAWWDVTDGGYDYVYENDVFLPGHQYQCEVYVRTDDGYEFVMDLYTNPETWPTATMNGNPANIIQSGSNLMWEQKVSYTFTCSQAVVSAVEVSGIEAPVVGQTPDYSGTVGNATLYGFAAYGFDNAGFWWYDSDDVPLTDQDTFVAGETYKLEIKLTPAKIEQFVASRFQTPVTATLNGKAVDPSDVMANSTTVYIYQTYTCRTTPTVLVEGAITSSGYEGGDVTVQLIPQGMSEPAYETVVTGNPARYYFVDVPKGTYTLRVVKAYHDVYTKTVVINNSATHNVALVKNGPVFADVSQSSWQHPFATYVCERGLMAGKGTDGQGRIKFDPNKPITREEFVQVLYNAEGKPAVTIANPFPDVAENGWYKNAVLWAKENNIANGGGDGKFGVGARITRQDLALMLYKYATLKGCSLQAESGKIDGFADGNKVASYAKTAMDWAVTNGILSGKGVAGQPLSTFRLDPTGTATRAECAAMLKNFMTAFGL